jgi:YHS domain-containing protein
MASLLFRLLFVILILWLLRRVLGNFFSPSRRTGESENPAGVANNMVKDPVCGMYMDSRLAIRIENRKEAIYFCSEECKNKYLEKSTARV